MEMSWYWSLANAVLGFCCSFFITRYLAPLLIATALRLNIVDAPDGQLKKHKTPTPYLGGLAVYVGFITGLALTFPFKNNFFLLMLGATLLLFVGLIDDLIVLRPRQKLLGQIVAAFCFLKGGFYLKEIFLASFGSTFALIFWAAVSFFWILTVINAFNLVDVMDGLATTIALCVATSFLVIACLLQLPVVLILLACLAGALASFLLFNKPPAKVYLGDSGSLFIGGLLAVVPSLVPWGTYQLHGYLTPVVLFFIPLFEVVTLIIIRTYLKIPFYQGSPHHFALYLRNKGWSIKQVLALVVAQSFCLLLLAVAFLLAKITVGNLFFGGMVVILLWSYLIFYHGTSPKRD